jgi:hypothetical protein
MLSPARKQFAERLEAGDTGVFLLIEGKDEKANAAAQDLIRTLADEVASGKVKLYAGAADMFPGIPDAAPAQKPGEGEPAEKQPADEKPVGEKPAGEKPVGEASAKADDKPEQAGEPKQTVGLIRIARNDPQEQWLLRMLMASEPELEKYADEPMVFVVYGRGRALPAYIGAGITRENLLDCLYFISGACSCTVKEQNPGVDLLVRYDWENAARKMAEKFAGEEGADRFSVDNLFPELVFSAPKAKPAEGEAATGTAAASTTQPEIAAEPKSSVDSTTPAAADGSSSEPSEIETPANPFSEAPSDAERSAADSSSAATPSKSVDAQKNEVALVAPSTAASAKPGEKAAASDESPSVNAGASWYALAIGAGVVLILLFGATLLLYRPK